MKFCHKVVKFSSGSLTNTISNFAQDRNENCSVDDKKLAEDITCFPVRILLTFLKITTKFGTKKQLTASNVTFCHIKCIA